jgi:hypothetical protein
MTSQFFAYYCISWEFFKAYLPHKINSHPSKSCQRGKAPSGKKTSVSSQKLISGKATCGTAGYDQQGEKHSRDRWSNMENTETETQSGVFSQE